MEVLWIVLGIVVLLIVVLLVIYNGLVTLRVRVDEAWSDITVQLKRRADLLPNLIETVKGYAKHESGVFEEITRLRSQWGEAKTQDAKIEAADRLEGALSKLMLVVENYPDLKANQGFLALQDELAGTENRISVERRRYNDAVREYNVTVRTFPNNLTAMLFGYKTKPSFSVENEKSISTAPKVDFGK